MTLHPQVLISQRISPFDFFISAVKDVIDGRETMIPESRVLGPSLRFSEFNVYIIYSRDILSM